MARDGASCDGFAGSWPAAEDFFSDFSYGLVVWVAAVGVGWTLTPGLALPVVPLVAAGLDAVVAVDAAELGVRLGARDETLVPAMFCASPVMMASGDWAWAGAGSSKEEPEVCVCSAAVRSSGLLLPGVELSVVGMPAFELLDLAAAGCLVFVPSVMSARLTSRTGDCSVGIGTGAGAEDVGEVELPNLESLDLGTVGCLAFASSLVRPGLVLPTRNCSVAMSGGLAAENVGAVVGDKVLKAELAEATGLALWAGDGTGVSFGWTAEFSGNNDPAGGASTSAGVSGAGENGTARTDGDWIIGDWSSTRMVAPVGIRAWNWLSVESGAVEAASVGETGA